MILLLCKQLGQRSRILLLCGKGQEGTARQLGQMTRILLLCVQGVVGTARQLGQRSRILLFCGQGVEGAARQLGQRSRILLLCGQGVVGTARQLGQRSKILLLFGQGVERTGRQLGQRSRIPADILVGCWLKSVVDSCLWAWISTGSSCMPYTASRDQLSANGSSSAWHMDYAAVPCGSTLIKQLATLINSQVNPVHTNHLWLIAQIP